MKATYRFFGSIHVLRHKDGRKYPFELLRTYSDSGKIIRSVNTECEYIDAIDPTSENRKYVETTKDIQLDYSLLSPEINNSHVEP